MHLDKAMMARTRNTLFGALDRRIAFFHLPKCGGTSLTDAMKSLYRTLDFRDDRRLVSVSSHATSAVVEMVSGTRYPYDTTDDYPILQLREHLLIYLMLQKQTRFVNGHCPFSENVHERFKDRFAFVTMIRSPVKRWISSFFYNRYKKGEHRKIDTDIAGHLESEFGRSQGHELVKFIGGADPAGDYTSTKAIGRAKANLHRFDLVGFLENMDDFLNRFEALFGRKLQLNVMNRNPVSSSRQEEVLTDEILSRIEAVCEPDLAVYRHALEHCS